MVWVWVIIEERGVDEQVDDLETAGEVESDSTHEMTEVVEESSGVTKFLVLDDSIVVPESDVVAVELDHESEDVEGIEASPVESSEEEQSSAEESDSSTPPLRRTSRKAVPRKMYTYTELGGDPTQDAIT